MHQFLLKLLTLVLLSSIFVGPVSADDDTFIALKRDMWEMGLDFEYTYGDPAAGSQHIETRQNEGTEELSLPILNTLLKAK